MQVPPNVLASHPVGSVKESDLSYIAEAVAVHGDGRVLVEVTCLKKAANACV